MLDNLNCKLQKLYRLSGQEVDVTLSTISVTIFEDISKFAISGSMIIHDSINLASFFPLIGQEYLASQTRNCIYNW